MENLDISDLPTPVARALKTVAKTVRRELAAKPASAKASGEKVKLTLCEGKVIGKLS